MSFENSAKWNIVGKSYLRIMNDVMFYLIRYIVNQDPLHTYIFH